MPAKANRDRFAGILQAVLRQGGADRLQDDRRLTRFIRIAEDRASPDLRDMPPGISLQITEP